MNPHLSQLLMVLRDDFKPSRQHLLLPDLANAAASRLDMAPERAAIPYALVLHLRAPLHPFVDLFPPQVDLALDALCELLLEGGELVGECAGREAELGVERGEELGLRLKVGVAGVEEGGDGRGRHRRDGFGSSSKHARRANRVLVTCGASHRAQERRRRVAVARLSDARPCSRRARARSDASLFCTRAAFPLCVAVPLRARRSSPAVSRWCVRCRLSVPFALVAAAPAQAVVAARSGLRGMWLKWSVSAAEGALIRRCAPSPLEYSH